MTSDFNTKITKLKTALENVFVKKSSTTGLIKNDGSIDTSTYLTSHQDITGKEDLTNKSSNITTDTGSTSKYPTVKAVEDYAVQKIPMGDVYGTTLNSTSLQKQISNASSGDTIVLDKDYLNNSNSTHILFSSKNITIIGNGHIIDGNNKLITFSASGTTTLKISNCVFQNLTLTTAQTLFRATDSAKIIIDNCIFKNIKIKQFSGIINTDQEVANASYTSAEIKILNSLFLSITGYTFLKFCDTNFSIINTIFENNAIDSILVNNTSSTNFTQEIINCVFNNNYPAITDSSTGVKSLVLKNNHFLQSGDTVTGCVNNNYLTEHQDISSKVDASDLSTVAMSGSYTDLDNKPDIPTKTSDLTNDADGTSGATYILSTDSRLTDSRTPQSHTHGNLQDDGKVGTTNNASKNVVTDSNGKITTEDKPTIPSASSTTPNADTSSGSYGSGTDYARANHQHPKSSLYAEASHSHGDITNDGKITATASYASVNDKILMADGSDGKIKRKHNILSSQVTDYNAYVNFSTNGESTQSTINSEIDTVLSNKADSNHSHNISDLADDVLGSLAYENDVDLTIHDVSELTDDYDTAFTPKSHTHTVSNITDFPTIPVDVTDLTDDYDILYDLVHLSDLGAVATSNDYGDLDNLPSIPQDVDDLTDVNSVIPSDVSDLSDNSNTQFTPKSHSHGKLENDGTIKINNTAQTSKNVVTDSSGKITTEDKPTIPSASSSTPSADVSGGAVGSGTTWAKADHQHPLSSAYATNTHAHGNITNDGKCSTTGTVDVSRGDLLLFADATSGANQYKIKGSTFVDALNDLILDLIDEGES